MTARLVRDTYRKLTPEERKKAYAERFKPNPPPIPVLGRPLIGRENVESMRAEEITPRHLMLLARRNTLPVLERLFELAMMDHGGDPEMARICVLAAGSFLNRAGLYEVKGQVAAIYAKVERDQAKIDEAEQRIQTVDVGKLTEGLTPPEPML
jgi:hypothetical protein